MVGEERHVQDSARPSAAGGVIAGRYQLLARVGADVSVHAEFWRARDTVLARDVGLTILRRTGEPAESARAAEMISKALRGGRFDHPGRARLLDVIQPDNRRGHTGLPEDVLGLAVAEWVAGQTLADTVATGPLRTAAVLAMLDPLAQGTEAAHRQGLVLGCAHPQRIRITADGGARLAFALPHPDATAADDVRGLGATLYALLTRHWPLSGADAELAGLPQALRDAHGVVQPPDAVRQGVSLEVSALALGALGTSHPRVDTAATVHKVLSELLAAELATAMLPPPEDSSPVGTDEVWQVETGATRDRDRSRKVSVGIGGLALAVIAVIAYMGLQVGSLLGLTSTPRPRIVVSAPTTAAPSTALATPQPNLDSTPAGSSAPVVPANVAVYDPTGDPDNAGAVAQVLASEPGPGWSTYTYRQPFPALKPGVGVMATFTTPEQLSALTINSPSPGSQVRCPVVHGPRPG